MLIGASNRVDRCSFAEGLKERYAVFAIIVALSLPIIVGMRSVAPVVLCAFLSFAIAVFCGIPIAGLAARFFEPLGFLYFLLVALPEEISRAGGLLILLRIFAKTADAAGDIFPFQKLPLFHIGAILFYLAIIAVCRSRRSAKAV